MKTKTIIPRGKNILVKPDEEESRTTESGLVTPDNVEQEKKATGKIIEIGPEVKKDAKVGKRVIYGVFSGDEIETPSFDHSDAVKLSFRNCASAISKAQPTTISSAVTACILVEPVIAIGLVERSSFVIRGSSIISRERWT